MGVDPPFLYDKPTAWNFDGPTGRGFNPKAATRASWTPKTQKPKQDGPLINFNRHPDSYFQSPYGNINIIPMSPNTRRRVNIAWQSQRILRILTLLGALGGVFCIITIRKTSTAVGWIIRIGPAVGVGHALYAVYFLCRGINSRPPASCASYQMFAALLDTGLIPFFALSCYMATMDYTSNAYGWDTLFNDNIPDYKIIQAFMIICGVVGGLLVISLVLDVYLAVTYRKITHLPPDMNPLGDKDNLTARPHHKRNKSELLYEKHLSNSTLASQRYSQMSQETAESRRVPYKHTRTDSVDRDSFSFKKDFVNEFKDPYGARASMSIDRDGAIVSRPSSAIMPAANARPAGSGLEHKPARSSNLAQSSPARPTSWLSYTDYEGMPADISDYAQHEFEQQVRTMSPVSAVSDRETQIVRKLASPPRNQRPVAPQHSADGQENDMPSPAQLSLALPPDFTPHKKRSRDPLGMNPPTPVNQQFGEESLVVEPLTLPGYATPSRQSLHEIDTNPITQYATPASHAASFVGSGTKSRFYGNLRGSLGGSPTRNNVEDIDDLHRSDTTKSAESGNFEVYASDSEEDYDPYRAQYHAPAVLVGNISTGHEWDGQRQVSNSTGYDLHSGYAGLNPEFADAIPRRREVSGKLAEEGRGYEIQTQPVQVSTRAGPGAAGWARFKGL